LGIAEGRSLFYGVILQNSITEDALFKEISTVLNPIGLQVVDARKDKHRETTHVVVIITTEDHRAGIDECAKAHKILFPRLSLMQGDRHLDLEVSTPGVQRSFRDIHEFTLFTGKRCRVYDSRIRAWVEGIISESQDGQVILRNATVEDTSDLHEEYHIPYSQIHKAKLAYAWEDM
jgi:ribosome maturation factor RimP